MCQVLVKLGKNGAETFEMSKLLLVMTAFVVLANVNVSMGLSRMSVDDDPQTGRSSTSKEGAVHFEYVPEGDKMNQCCYV
jgi:hypothetical protein